jgi:hypothetical protein
VEYVAVEEFDPEAISNRVEELLKDGWVLQENLVLVAYYAQHGKTENDKHRTIYAQALIKHEQSELPDPF